MHNLICISKYAAPALPKNKKKNLKGSKTRNCVINIDNTLNLCDKSDWIRNQISEKNIVLWLKSRSSHIETTQSCLRAYNKALSGTVDGWESSRLLFTNTRACMHLHGLHQLASVVVAINSLGPSCESCTIRWIDYQDQYLRYIDYSQQ